MKELIRTFENGKCIVYSVVKRSPISMDCINLNDKYDNPIFVGDILYWKDRDIYFTVFEVPGGYAIEGNPTYFGLHDNNDQLPVYESTADMQTSSFIQGSLEVSGNMYSDKDKYDKIRDEYKSKKGRRS